MFGVTTSGVLILFKVIRNIRFRFIHLILYASPPAENMAIKAMGEGEVVVNGQVTTSPNRNFSPARKPSKNTTIYTLYCDTS